MLFIGINRGAKFEVQALEKCFSPPLDYSFGQQSSRVGSSVNFGT